MTREYNIEDVGDVVKALERARAHAHACNDVRVCSALTELLDTSRARTETVTVRLNGRVKALASLVAKQQGRTLSGFIAHTVKEAIEQSKT
jgi:predicted HicB family RNase H-like nuclease